MKANNRHQPVALIDENISEIEVWRLREWGVVVRQIGPEVARPSSSTAEGGCVPRLMKGESWGEAAGLGRGWF